MRVHMDFHDDATPIFEKFAKVNLGLVKEGLSRASSQLADEYKTILKAESPSDWGVVSRNGKRSLSLDDKKSQFGEKYNRVTGEKWVASKGKPANLADHITFYTPPRLDDLYAVVGGGHKGFRPITYTNGTATGYKNIYIPATSQETLAILDKINDGHTQTLTKKQKRLFSKTRKNGEAIGGQLQTVTFKPRRFAEKARLSGGDKAMGKVRNLYETNFPKAVNAMNVKTVFKETAV